MVEEEIDELITPLGEISTTVELFLFDIFNKERDSFTSLMTTLTSELTD